MDSFNPIHNLSWLSFQFSEAMQSPAQSLILFRQSEVSIHSTTVMSLFIDSHLFRWPIETRAGYSMRERWYGKVGPVIRIFCPNIWQKIIYLLTLNFTLLYFFNYFYNFTISLDLGCANGKNIQLMFHISSFNLLDVRALQGFLRMIMN